MPLIQVNPAFTRITGWPAERALGRDCRWLLPGDTDGEAIRAALREGDGVSLELRHHRRDGSPLWAELSLASLPEGRILLSLKEVTEHRARAEMLAALGHEIRTPLNGLIGTIGLLLEAGLDPGQRRLAGMAQSSAERLLSAVNDFLDSEKLGAGRLELESVEFELGETVEAAVELLACRAAQKGLELVVDIPASLHGKRRGDPARLGQMLLNLASNAVKFTERGHVLVSVREATKGALRFEVVDSGPGIEPAAIARLFRRFSQADASIARRFGGSGLGLAIVKELAELMGGEVGVKSQPGAGARFWVQLPLPRCGGEEETLEFGGRRALAVEAGRQTRMVMVRRLLELGLEVEAAADGLAGCAMAEAAAARQRPFDLVLLDRGVPGGLPMLDGVAIARRLRASGARLLLCAHAGQALAAEERALFAAVLTRPLRHRALLKALAGGGEAGAAEVPPLRARPGPGRHLLLAEDDPVTREVAMRLLEGAGHRVTAVVDGEAAVTAVAAQKFSLVLMDLEMPGIGGLEALRRLRTLGAGVPVLALTAHAGPGLRERLLAAGMCGYLPKPFRPAELLGAVTAALEEASPLDADTVASLARLPRPRIRRILEEVESETVRLMAPLGAAVAGQEAEPARRNAHALVGALGACGAIQAAALARRLEQAVQAGDLAAAAGLLPSLWEAREAAMPALRERLLPGEAVSGP
jgi:PAS domain S-box-containing protein